jgi:hypothetical protein
MIICLAAAVGLIAVLSIANRFSPSSNKTDHIGVWSGQVRIPPTAPLEKTHSLSGGVRVVWIICDDSKTDAHNPEIQRSIVSIQTSDEQGTGLGLAFYWCDIEYRGPSDGTLRIFPIEKMNTQVLTKKNWSEIIPLVTGSTDDYFQKVFNAGFSVLTELRYVSAVRASKAIPEYTFSVSFAIENGNKLRLTCGSGETLDLTLEDKDPGMTIGEVNTK